MLCNRGVFLTEALAELDFSMYVNCTIVPMLEVKRVACYARAETYTETVASVASMVAIPLALLGNNLCLPYYVKYHCVKILLVQRTIKTSGEHNIFSLLISAIDGIEGKGIVFFKFKSRAAVVITGALVTGTGGGVRVH